jgi:hypothetical protein
MTSSEPRLRTEDLAGVPADDPTTAEAPDEAVDPGAGSASAEDQPLLGPDESAGFRTRWEALQTGFVDEPRAAVEGADALVAELMQTLARSFAEERAGLEAQWSRGDDVSTEDLRLALQRYRSFFGRLLAA